MNPLLFRYFDDWGDKFNIKLKLTHRELNIDKIL